ncbi:MAG TPA: DUF3617 family protein [Allosphingosinicella sp.]|jgi:hypothetical protein
MRYWMMLPLCAALGACGGETAPEPKAEEQAATMAAGQWETAFEVTAMRSTDTTTPAVKAAVGDKAAASTCVTEADKAKPDPAIFAGEGYTCKYAENTYIRGGRLNASLSCTHEGVKGEIMMQIDGSYKGDSFEARANVNSYLPGSGDFAMTRTLKGRKTGDTCTAPATGADGNGTVAKAGA